MTLAGSDVLFYTLAFLVPGFIMHLTLSIFVPRRTEQSELSFLRFLALSCMNYAIWSWLIYLILATGLYSTHPYRVAFVWGVIILVSPVIIGIVLARLSQKEIPRTLLQRFGFNPIHEIPTAWDYQFSRIDAPTWALVTMNDGSTVAGLFGSQSFASSDPSERDLYLQEVLRAADGGTWQRVARNEGILIRGDQIKYIEFWCDSPEKEMTK